MKKSISVLITLSLIAFSSCADKQASEEDVCSDPILPETLVKMYRDSSYVDSLIILIPLSESDTLQFISLKFPDTTGNYLQKKIFQINRINRKVKYKSKAIKFWFTRITHRSDTTKDFGLFAVLRDNKAIENCRFRFNSKNDIIGVNTNPFLNKTFESLDRWAIDTLQREE
jgi:hypothetical protein